jgi:hypothetical protein
MGKQDIFDTTAIFKEEYEVKFELTHNILLDLKFLSKISGLIPSLKIRPLGCDNPGP